MTKLPDIIIEGAKEIQHGAHQAAGAALATIDVKSLNLEKTNQLLAQYTPELVQASSPDVVRAFNNAIKHRLGLLRGRPLS